MVSLLDVNVLVALFDPSHLHHESAHQWFGAHREEGWATCPLTENALLRILSHPKYSGGGRTVSDVTQRLTAFRRSVGHVFWPDDLSLCEEGLFETRHAKGHRQITDIYLLALAVRKKGRLVTFDTNIPLRCIAGATEAHVMLLSP